MNAVQAEKVVRRLAGYWPSPQMSDEEALAWVETLTDPAVDVTPEEALAVVRRAIYAGDAHRPRPGQLVAAVRSERHWSQLHSDTKALVAGRTEGVNPERVSQWVRVCKRTLAGEPLATAKQAEGIVA